VQQIQRDRRPPPGRRPVPTAKRRLAPLSVVRPDPEVRPGAGIMDSMPATVLTVEDDDGIRILLEAVFRSRFVAVEFACDGRIALDRLRERTYDVLVLDLMLPAVNGSEVIRELKKRNPDLLARTFVLTAASNRTLRDFDDARLVHRVMRKPFDLGDFIHEVLSCASASPEAATAAAY